MPTSDEAMTDYLARLEQSLIDEARKPGNQMIPRLEILFAQYDLPPEERQRLRTIVLAHCWETVIKQTLMHEGPVH